MQLGRDSDKKLSKDILVVTILLLDGYATGNDSRFLT